jgi:hypothetical protein
MFSSAVTKVSKRTTWYLMLHERRPTLHQLRLTLTALGLKWIFAPTLEIYCTRYGAAALIQSAIAMIVISYAILWSKAPRRLTFIWYRERGGGGRDFYGVKTTWGASFTRYLPLLLMLRMPGAMPLLPHMPLSNAHRWLYLYLYLRAGYLALRIRFIFTAEESNVLIICLMYNVYGHSEPLYFG